MKAVILAGGLGSRLSEETALKPKPMVELGERPILWHILNIYAAHGITDFIICLGYLGRVIKEYFANYVLYSADITIDLAKNQMEYHRNGSEPWRITLVDTGNRTMTGGRLKRVLPYLEGEDAFCFTYGDGVSDVDITKLVEFHRKSGKLATLTAAQPVGRFGGLTIKENGQIAAFSEKPKGDGRWVNGGFFVLSPKVGEYIAGDETSWEAEPLQKLAADGQLVAYQHDGFWQPMDTIHDRGVLEALWASGKAPWKVW